jgi:hypothetical protein
MSDAQNPLDWFHPAADIASGGRTIEREATIEECVAVATELGLIGCARLAMSARLTLLGAGRVRLAGTCQARVVQPCIVTLEPVEGAVVLPMDVEFWPETAAPEPVEGEAAILDLPEIETLENGRVPVGRVVFETLAAGLDPYPRKPGATFAWEDPKAQDGVLATHPFASLAKLKPKD